MNVVLNEWDDTAKYYLLWDLEKLNNNMTKRRNCYGTVVFATSKVQYNVAKHSNFTKNEKSQQADSQPQINPFTIPLEADDTKLTFRMPLENVQRHNYASVLLTALDSDHRYFKSVPRPEWVPRLGEIVRVLDTEYDKINFAFIVPQGFKMIKGIEISSSATLQSTQLF